MANAPIDQNYVPSILAVLSTDGATVTPVAADPVTRALSVSDGTTGSDLGPDRALRDDNYVTTMTALSSVDGTSLVALYADADGRLLIQSS